MIGREEEGTALLDAAKWRRSIFDVLIEHAKERGGDIAVEDQDRTPLSYHRLLLGSLVLGKKIAARTEQGERVGVLLPNVVAIAVTVYGLFAYGRVPAMLNYTTGPGGLTSAARSVGVKTILTSRRFVETANLGAKVEALRAVADIVYLEDVRKSVSRLDQVRGLIDGWRVRGLHKRYRSNPDDVAVILFTSGTERQPKGVALTHANILANIEEVRVSIGCTPQDIFLNPLPVFHALGLMAGLFLPLVIGFRTVLYPSPLHYEEIPKLAKSVGATIMIGIDTFAAGWARQAKGDEFKSLRLMVLGAEKVKDATRRLWHERCGIEILEGYGVTEASPVVSVNRPGANREGTVGPLLPGIEMRLEAVEGIEHGKRLLIRGPNIMAGYYFADQPNVLHPPKDGWHDTGDIVSIDEDGYVTIVGRAKRFAKIAGEMISLSTAEWMMAEAEGEGSHVAVAAPDPRKGEAVVGFTTSSGLSIDAIRKVAARNGISELAVPARLVVLPELPLLGNGKTDYVSLEELAAAAQAA